MEYVEKDSHKVQTFEWNKNGHDVNKLHANECDKTNNHHILSLKVNIYTPLTDQYFIEPIFYTL